MERQKEGLRSYMRERLARQLKKWMEWNRGVLPGDILEHLPREAEKEGSPMYPEKPEHWFWNGRGKASR